MNDNQIYVLSQIQCANIECVAMQAENQHRMNCGNSIAYGYDEFMELQNKYGIHHNATLATLQDNQPQG